MIFVEKNIYKKRNGKKKTQLSPFSRDKPSASAHKRILN